MQLQLVVNNDVKKENPQAPAERPEWDGLDADRRAARELILAHRISPGRTVADTIEMLNTLRRQLEILQDEDEDTRELSALLREREMELNEAAGVALVSGVGVLISPKYTLRNVHGAKQYKQVLEGLRL